MNDKIIPHEIIPFLLRADDPAVMAQMFDGPVAKVGDIVDLVCYEVGESNGSVEIKLKWKVRT